MTNLTVMTACQEEQTIRQPLIIVTGISLFLQGMYGRDISEKLCKYAEVWVNTCMCEHVRAWAHMCVNTCVCSLKPAHLDECPERDG